jgi:hypothetical protein
VLPRSSCSFHPAPPLSAAPLQATQAQALLNTIARTKSGASSPDGSLLAPATVHSSSPSWTAAQPHQPAYYASVVA